MYPLFQQLERAKYFAEFEENPRDLGIPECFPFRRSMWKRVRFRNGVGFARRRRRREIRWKERRGRHQSLFHPRFISSFTVWSPKRSLVDIYHASL